jgi:hypothetical protein
MNLAPPTMTPDPALDNECINTLRFLSVDAVQKADSGHPGMSMGDGRRSDGVCAVDPLPQTRSGQP